MHPPVPFVGSIAIVRRGHEHEAEWLTVWDEIRSAWRFPEARKDNDQTFRTCLIPVLESELHLTSKDYLLSGFSLAHHQAPVEWPDAEQPSWVVVEFFPVDLYGSKAKAKVAELDNVRWWSMHDLAAGLSVGGESLCERQHVLLKRADILPPWVG